MPTQDERDRSDPARASVAPSVRPAFYTASETAEILRLDESTLYRHLRGGTFPGLKIGGRYVVPGAVLERLVAAVLLTGRCVDVGCWTETWRQQQTAAVTAAGAATDVTLPGGDF